jgi:uracil-DNA glycosylase family 4
MGTIELIKNLNDEIKTCKKCRLTKTRKNVLCGEGNLYAELMLIAQAPGEKEDKEDKMFIGPSGKVLDGLLRSIRIDRKEIFMTNLIKCMLPKNRKPKSDEIATCSQYLDREIELIHPEILAPLGYYATRYILEKYGIPSSPKREFRRIYGNVLEVDGKTIIPLQHPAAVLHDISIKSTLVTNYRKMQALYMRLSKKGLHAMRRKRDTHREAAK